MNALRLGRQHHRSKAVRRHRPLVDLPFPQNPHLREPSVRSHRPLLRRPPKKNLGRKRRPRPSILRMRFPTILTSTGRPSCRKKKAELLGQRRSPLRRVRRLGKLMRVTATSAMVMPAMATLRGHSLLEPQKHIVTRFAYPLLPKRPPASIQSCPIAFRLASPQG